MKVTILTLYLLAFLFTFSTKIFAVDFTVNTTNDLPDTNAGDGNCLTTAGNCSLRAAVQEANTLATNDRVMFNLPANSIITLTVANGRGISIIGNGTLEIIGTGANNLTIDGIGIGTSIFRTNATVTISGVTLTRGQGDVGTGGAIYAIGGSLTLDRVYITRNSANNLQVGGGGGIFFQSGTHRILNSTISANFGNGCGGIVNRAGSSLTIVNSTISSNNGGRGTGGLCNYGIANLRNVTITNNTAGNSGGIFNTGILDFGNTIVAGNTSFGVPEISFAAGTITSAGGNLVGDSPGDSMNTGNFPITYQPTDIRDVNPLLGILQNNGGTTLTHALFVGSPAIDSGLNELAVDPSGDCPELVFDQRGTGFPRIVDGNNDGTVIVDIGALESQSPLAPPTPTPIPTPTPTPPLILTVTRSDDRNNANCAAGDCSLREAVNAANASDGNDAIYFALGIATITLTDSININNAGSLTIIGRGADVLTIDGGGLIRLFFTNNATVNIYGITFTGGNGAVGARGGAIYAIGGSLTIEYVWFKNNRSDGLEHGGAVEFSGGIHLIANSTISDNSGRNCAGVVNDADSTLTINNSTISGNNGRGVGGFCNDGTATLRNVTIANNTAVFGGGGISNRGTLDFGNTIVASNTSGLSNPEIQFWNGTITSAGGNLVGDSPGDSTNTGNFPITYQPTDIRDVNPLLGALRKNGVIAPTHALFAASPAIDKGIDFGLAADQRGYIRPIDFSNIPNVPGGNGADIGAFERFRTETIRFNSFDFDGDGKSDISTFRPTSGVWHISNSQIGFSATQFGISTDKIVPADYDGDGKTDIAVYRPAEGIWYLLRSTAGFTAFQFGIAEDIPQPADFDGDGKAELVVYRPSNGTWYIFNLVNNNFSAVQFGIATDKPIVGDYDGDGRADYAVYRPAEGNWYIHRSRTGFTATQFGIASDRPVTGDYDGDGRTDIAVYRPSNGVWYLLRSTAGFTSTQFGIPTDVPTPGDYDGDGQTDIAVYRPAEGIWYLLRSAGGFTSIRFGSDIDRPVPNAYVPLP